MCIHPCCCVLLLCNFHHLCNAPGDKNAAKQAAHLISCNWLPFYRPCSFASQTFVCFADFLIIAFKILQKTYFIILHCSTLHKKNLTALTLKNKKKEQPIHILELFSFFRSPRSIDITVSYSFVLRSFHILGTSFCSSVSFSELIS